RLRLWAWLHRPPPQLNPGGRDRRATLAVRGISLEGNADLLAVVERGPPFWRWLDGLRARFAARAEQICSSRDRAGLVAAPAVGAGVGAAVALLGSALARRGDGLTTLALGGAACALLDPAATHDLALQLSVAGISGLLVLARPLREMLPLPLPPAAAPLWRRAAEHLLRLGCATAAASLCTAPLLAAAFHRVSIVSVAANALALLPGLLAIPIATALV